MRLSRSAPADAQPAGPGGGPRRPDVVRPGGKAGRLRRSNPVCVAEGRRETAASVLQPSAPALVLPVLRGVPVTISLDGTREISIPFAERLLDTSVLVSADWTGDLGASLDSGLQRWIQEIPGGRKCKPGAQRWRFFDLDIFGCDDVEGTIGGYYDDYEPGSWPYFAEGTTNGPVCGLGLGVRHYTEAIVGATVRRIERRCKGAGFALLSVAQSAIGGLVGCGGPRWAHDHMSEMEHGYCDDDEAEESGYPTLSQIEREMPKQALQRGEADLTVIKRASEMRWQGGVREAMRAAIAIQPSRKDARNFGHESIFGGWPLLPVRICWTKGDCVESVFDMYHDDLQNSGTSPNDSAFFRAFQADAPGEISVNGAADAMERCVQMLDLCDVMLWGLCDHAQSTTTETEHESEPQRIEVTP